MPPPDGGDPRVRQPAPPPPFVPPPPPPPFSAGPEPAAGEGSAGPPPGWEPPEEDPADGPVDRTSTLPVGGGPDAGPPLGPGRGGTGVRERRLAAAVAALAAVVVVVAAALVAVDLLSGGHRRASAGHEPPATSAPPRTATTTPATTTPPTTAPAGSAASAVAAQIAAQVARSGDLRQSVDNSITQVAACSLPPSQGRAAVEADIASRRKIIDTLATLRPEGLPHGREMIGALRRSLADSVAADGQYAHWMGDVAGGSPPCSNPSADSYYSAAQSQSQRATADKQAFLALWNPVAPGYGQPTYSASDF